MNPMMRMADTRSGFKNGRFKFLLEVHAQPEGGYTEKYADINGIFKKRNHGTPPSGLLFLVNGTGGAAR